MNNKCNIITDILPLYAEDMVNDDTKEFVEQHVVECENCKNKLKLLKSDIPVKNDYQEDKAVDAMKKIRLDMNKKHVAIAVISAIISAIIVVLSFAYLTAPEYLPYTEQFDIVSVKEANGSVSLSFTGEYELSQRESGVYTISVYNTICNQLFNLAKEQTITVNPNNEAVTTIYYVSNGGWDEDEVIYGENPVVNGGVLTLPRLNLNSYLVLAVGAFILVFVLLLILRKNKKMKDIMSRLLLVPFSYVISSITITGFNATSYSATRDLYLILILALIIYLAMYLVYCKKIRR